MIAFKQIHISTVLFLIMLISVFCLLIQGQNGLNNFVNKLDVPEIKKKRFLIHNIDSPYYAHVRTVILGLYFHDNLKPDHTVMLPSADGKGGFCIKFSDKARLCSIPDLSSFAYPAKVIFGGAKKEISFASFKKVPGKFRQVIRGKGRFVLYANSDNSKYKKLNLYPLAEKRHAYVLLPSEYANKIAVEGGL